MRSLMISFVNFCVFSTLVGNTERSSKFCTSPLYLFLTMMSECRIVRYSAFHVSTATTPSSLLMELLRKRGLLIPFFSVLIAVSSSAKDEMEELKDVEIPSAMVNMATWTIASSTDCSVTCGIGTKVNKLCFTNKTLSDNNCKLEIVQCFTSWLCGMEVFSVKVGYSFTLDCVIPPEEAILSGLIYNWKVAPGIVSINDIFFRPLKIKNATIVYESIQERNAGTYRCDVQQENDLRLVKRKYFGVKVISPDIIEMDYDKYLMSKQSIQEGLTFQVAEKKIYIRGGLSTYIGVGSFVGILMGIVVLALIRCARKRKAVKSASTGKL